jgi:hypothetical protein
MRLEAILMWLGAGLLQLADGRSYPIISAPAWRRLAR